MISFIAQLRYKESVFEVIFADGIYCIKLGNKSFVVEKAFMKYFICKFFIGEIKQTDGDSLERFLEHTDPLNDAHPLTDAQPTHSSINRLRKIFFWEKPLDKSTLKFNQKYV